MVCAAVALRDDILRLGRAAQYAPRCCRSRGARRAASRWSRFGSAPVSRQATGSAGPSRRRGGDSNLSSGISSREGGISTAIEARVDEAILYLQSGHGHALPARAYMHLTSPNRFLEIPEALGLCLAAAIEISSLASSNKVWGYTGENFISPSASKNLSPA